MDWKEYYKRARAKTRGIRNAEWIVQDAIGSLFLQIHGQTRPPKQPIRELYKHIRQAIGRELSGRTRTEQLHAQLDQLNEEQIDCNETELPRLLRIRHAMSLELATLDPVNRQDLHPLATLELGRIITPGFRRPYNGTELDLYGPIITIDTDPLHV